MSCSSWLPITNTLNLGKDFSKANLCFLEKGRSWWRIPGTWRMEHPNYNITFRNLHKQLWLWICADCPILYIVVYIHPQEYHHPQQSLLGLTARQLKDACHTKFFTDKRIHSLLYGCQLTPGSLKFFNIQTSQIWLESQCLLIPLC